MTRAGIRLRDVPRTIGWSGLIVFLQHVPPDSATMRAEHPEMGGWTRTEVMLADVFDAVQCLRWQLAATFARTKPREPDKYPRPWDEGNTRRIGAGAIPVSKFWDWWESE